MDVLAGYGTYVIAALAALVTAAYVAGLIDQVQWEKIMGILVPAGAVTFRRAISRVPEITADKAAVVAKKLAKEECKNNGSSTPY